MTTIDRLKTVFIKYFIDLRWHSLIVAIALYFAISWCFLFLAGEYEITQNSNFIYWMIVTASTVGYGDLYPTTTHGQTTVALFVIPLGLSLFGLVIGRLASFVSYQWRKSVQGLKKLNYENHILIIGWNGNRTLQLINLLMREVEFSENKQKIALCVKVDIENPLPDKIGFVKVTSFSDDKGMDRAAVSNASSIIIDNPEDDMTMTIALYCAQRNPNAHAIAYFREERLGALLKSHCPNIECMPSVAVEMMAKSAVDPGSSVLHHQLLDSNDGMTQFSLKYSGTEIIKIAGLFHLFKEKYDATLIGISTGGPEAIELNPDLQRKVVPGCTLYYIAAQRIKKIEWT